MMADNASQKSHGSSSGGGGYTNGHSGGVSPNSSQLSMDGRESTLITRTQKQHITQNVTTTTKTIREVQYIGPDGLPIDFIPGQEGTFNGHGGHMDYQNQQFADYHQYQQQQQYPHDYNRPPTPPSPSERSNSPLNNHRGFAPQPGGGFPRSGYDELDTTLMPPRPGADPYARNTPSPGASGHPGYAVGPSAYTSPATSQYPAGQGRPSLTDSYQGYPGQDQGYQGQDQGQYPGQEDNYQGHDGQYHGQEDMYGGHPEQQYGTYHPYDPNMSNSVFEDGDDGYGGQVDYPGGLTPLPGTLGSVSHTPQPREAPRAVFDDEEDQEPMPAGHPNHPIRVNKPLSSVGSSDHNRNNQNPQNSGMAGMRDAPVQWRDPDLHEVIEFLQNPNAVIKANAAAYLQHLCYMDDPVKAKTRQLGGIPPLVALLSHEIPEIHRNSCGALRNLSYGRQNDENKRAIKVAGGTNALVRLLRKTGDNEVKELVTGVLWNLSSCDDLKRTIIDEALLVIVNIVIIPHSGWDRAGAGGDTHWSTVFRNASGILRNVSSAGDYGRKKLRECEGLVDSLIYLVRTAIERANIDNKSVENAVCVLRNLSYRAQEIEDPNYDKRQLPAGESRAAATPSKDNLGCFGASKNKGKNTSSTSESGGRGRSGGNLAGMDLLWQPEVVQPYLNLLSNCSNPETLEAAAGAIQNLSACYWQPSIDIRAAVRKEKGLPILVELLRMEVDRVVCAVATALRNLAIDQRNKELIGKYAMRDLVQKLPSGNPQRDVGTSDDTIAAVLATLNEVIKKHPEFSRSLLEAGGVDRLMNVTRQRAKYTSSRVVKFASQVLFSMWQHQELREVYRKSGWKEADFVTKTVAARNARPNSPTHLNSTLNRPMASQGGTRYEDRTLARGGQGGQQQQNNSHATNGAAAYSADSVPMESLSLYSGAGRGGGASGASIYPPGQHLVRPGEPVYAQVNRDKKRVRGGAGDGGGWDGADYSEHALHWSQQQQQGQAGPQGQQGSHEQQAGGEGGRGAQQTAGQAGAGDSWV